MLSFSQESLLHKYTENFKSTSPFQAHFLSFASTLLSGGRWGKKSRGALIAFALGHEFLNQRCSRWQFQEPSQYLQEKLNFRRSRDFLTLKSTLQTYAQVSKNSIDDDYIARNIHFGSTAFEEEQKDGKHISSTHSLFISLCDGDEEQTLTALQEWIKICCHDDKSPMIYFEALVLWWFVVFFCCFQLKRRKKNIASLAIYSIVYKHMKKSFLCAFWFSPPDTASTWLWSFDHVFILPRFSLWFHKVFMRNFWKHFNWSGGRIRAAALSINANINKAKIVLSSSGQLCKY